MKLIYILLYINVTEAGYITTFKGKKVVIEPYNVILWAAITSVTSCV